MLKRKVVDQMRAWKENPRRNPLVVRGMRQCGKSFSVREFARENWEHVVLVDFVRNPEFARDFSGSLDPDTIIQRLKPLLGPEAVFEPGKTVLLLEDVDECPDARSSFKFFRVDARFDVMATAPLPCFRDSVKFPRFIPVGYEDVLEMRPLDFEEFLWANGVGEEEVSVLQESLRKRTAVPKSLGKKMWRLFLRYAVTGGMPDVVELSLVENSGETVLGTQREICGDLVGDLQKRLPQSERSRILEGFLSIPSLVAKEKRLSRDEAYRIGWLEEGGVVRRCRNLTSLRLPLQISASEDEAKLYTTDTGLFSGMLEDGTQADIVRKKPGAYNGPFFENLIADAFGKMGRPLYYFHQGSLEVDFVIRYQGEPTLVEVKATKGAIKSAKAILSQPEKFGVKRAIRLGDYNVREEDGILSLPAYMAFLLSEL